MFKLTSNQGNGNQTIVKKYFTFKFEKKYYKQ